MDEDEMTGGGGEGSETDDGLCDYERQRLQNIRKNHNLLRSLGLPLSAKPKLAPASKRGRKRGRKAKRGKKKNKVCSDSDTSFKCDSSEGESSSEDEWQPWKDEVKKKPRGKGAVKISPLDAKSKQEIFNAAKTEIRSKLKALQEGRKKAAVRQKNVTATDETKKKGRSRRNQADVVEELFQSNDDEEEEFIGFTGEEVEMACDEVCGRVPSAGREMWGALFGVEVDTEENDFDGFSRDEILATGVPDQSKYVSYRGRSMAKVDYQEEVISDDDEYLFCEDCQELHHGDCPVHGALTPLPDVGDDTNSKEFTKLWVPAQLTVKPSSIPGAGLGVFANENIARGVKFGPYVGKKVPASHVDEDANTSYMWEIKHEGVRSFFIDGRDEECSNWLRFINCARNEEEQNLIAFQFKGHIYYRTFKTVYPGNELLVWYGEEYARDLGIAVEQAGEQANYMCKGCGISFVEKCSFDIHLKHNKKCANANPRVFKCGKCQRTFNELRQLQIHIWRHQEYNDKENLESRSIECDDISFYEELKHSEGKVKGNRSDSRHHKCQYCGKIFTTAGNLCTHIRIHTGDKPYQCHHCGKSFNRSSNLHTHIRTHTGDKPYQCPHCGQSFSDSGNLRTHIQTHTGDKPYQCPHCGKSFSNSGALRTHIRTHTGDKPHQCPHCGKSFSNSGALRTHIRTHTGDKPYQCPHCGKSFNQSSNLHTHIRTHTGDKPYQCPHCGKSFSNSGALRTHIRTHTGDKPYQCPHCGKSFNQSSALRTHIRTHTGDKPYQCPHCGQSFNQSSALHTHIRTHTGDKPYQCPHCGKSFNQSGALRTHIRTHTGDKPYQCPHCGKSFSNSGALRTHIRTHTGDKPYQCPHCGKSFNQSGALRTHIRTHTGDKPYQCPHCGQSFSKSGHLHTHIRTHTGDKPYQCPHCGQSFSKSGALRTHIRTHTGDNPYQRPSFNTSDHHTLRKHSETT